MGRRRLINLKNSVKKLLDKNPIGIDAPFSCYRKTDDNKRRLLGFVVVVKYRYRANKEQVFVVKNQCPEDRKIALRNAINFYNLIKEQIYKDNQHEH